MLSSKTTRRTFLQQSAIASLGFYSLGFSKYAFSSEYFDHEIPDLSDDAIIRHVVGIRPYRKKRVRLEREDQGDKIIVHNYGHGGGGITTSWGCAEVAAQILSGSNPSEREVAVLGAGVVGLSTARVLQEMGFRVHVYSAKFSPETTSNLAGGQWSPASIAMGETVEERKLFDQILIRSYRHYEKIEGEKYGVSRRLNYFAGEKGGGLDRVPAGLIPPAEHFDRLPFPGPGHRGILYRTFLIEPPIYIPALMEDIRAAGGTFERRIFQDADDLRGLSENLVVNCMGLGAGEVFQDSLIEPIRGQLVHLKPKSLPYLLVHQGYLFPRQDALVLGGTFEHGEKDTTPNPETAEKILRYSREFFGV